MRFQESRGYDDPLHELGRQLCDLAQAASLPYRFLMIYYHVAVLWLKHHQLLRLARWRFASCHEVCESAPCLGNLAESIHTIRSGYETLVASSREFSLFLPLRKPFEQMLADWDEMSEDVAISSDPEIRSLLFRISDAV